jgi:hypothetical protein
MMASQIELKIMSETDPGSTLPRRALTDHLLIALPRVNPKYPRQNRLVCARFQYASMRHIPLHYPALPLSSARYTGPWLREQT